MSGVLRVHERSSDFLDHALGQMTILGQEQRFEVLVPELAEFVKASEARQARLSTGYKVMLLVNIVVLSTLGVAFILNGLPLSVGELAGGAAAVLLAFLAERRLNRLRTQRTRETEVLERYRELLDERTKLLYEREHLASSPH
jgi:hypothetical protein